MSIRPFRKDKSALASRGIRVYLSDYGSVRIETSHHRCEMQLQKFLELLKKAAQR